jgi:hypothetical protein
MNTPDSPDYQQQDDYKLLFIQADSYCTKEKTEILESWLLEPESPLTGIPDELRDRNRLWVTIKDRETSPGYDTEYVS